MSNKNEENIFRCKSSLTGCDFVESNFDDQSSVGRVTSKHSKAAVDDDEEIQCFRIFKTYWHTKTRGHPTRLFETIIYYFFGQNVVYYFTRSQKPSASNQIC